MTTWFRFYDWGSEGCDKTPWGTIFIKATDENAARDRFKVVFGFPSYWERCECCGEDYLLDVVDEPGEKTTMTRGWLTVGDGPLSDEAVAEMDRFDSPYADEWKERGK